MITAKDLQKYLDERDLDKNAIIDSWLKDVVFPNYLGSTHGFSCPKGVTLVEAENLLRKRGFHVITQGDYKGYIVYISIPPQDK